MSSPRTPRSCRILMDRSTYILHNSPHSTLYTCPRGILSRSTMKMYTLVLVLGLDLVLVSAVVLSNIYYLYTHHMDLCTIQQYSQIQLVMDMWSLE